MSFCWREFQLEIVVQVISIIFFAFVIPGIHIKIACIFSPFVIIIEREIIIHTFGIVVLVIIVIILEVIIQGISIILRFNTTGFFVVIQRILKRGGLYLVLRRPRGFGGRSVFRSYNNNESNYDNKNDGANFATGESGVARRLPRSSAGGHGRHDAPRRAHHLPA